LGRAPKAEPTPKVEEKPIIPDVVIPETPPIQTTQTFQPESPRISYSKSKNLFKLHKRFNLNHHEFPILNQKTQK